MKGGSEMSKTRVINRIRNLLFMTGEMTQQQLEDRVGVTRQIILAIESGKYSPTLELAFAIAKVFGKPLEQMFAMEENHELPGVIDVKYPSHGLPATMHAALVTR